MLHFIHLNLMKETMNQDITKEDLIKALENSKYRINTTGKYLGISRSTVELLAKKLGVELKDPISGVVPKYNLNSKIVNNIYYKMKSRCLSEKNKDFCHYGGRGIKIHKEWIENRDLFTEYISNLPNFGIDGYSLDRINNEEGYAPGNVRFALHKQQCRNRRNNLRVFYKGETRILIELCEELNLDIELVSDRIKDNWPVEEALFSPLYSKCSLSPKQRKEKYD